MPAAAEELVTPVGDSRPLRGIGLPGTNPAAAGASGGEGKPSYAGYSLLGPQFWLTGLEAEVYRGDIRGPNGLSSFPLGTQVGALAEDGR